MTEDTAAGTPIEVSAAETVETRDARPWLDLLSDAKKAFQTWQEKCDTIDKLYADLKTLATGGADREFQIFWANLEVLKPTIYSRSPVPVVQPRFRDRKQLPRRAADVLERALLSDFEADELHETLILARDDLATGSRGVVWLRYGQRDETEAAITDHVDREDFRHEPARKWSEVTWVAKRAWLTRAQWEKRFGEVPTGAKFTERDHGSDKEDGYRGERKAEVWEIWSKTEKAVLWVSPEVETVLDVQPPMIQVKGFFPCPRPAFGTLQRRTLIPVPDFVYYRDQVEEINELTARISGLAEALRMKGFYEAGVSDIGEAIEAALASQDNNAILVPVPGVGALGGKSLRDAIIWLPLLEVANTIRELIALRRQLIEDVYEITGISDIMRGSTEASETLGAQQLKAQFGNVRVRERQNEMARLARDVTRLKAEIMAENFDFRTLLEMSQVDDLPDAASVQQKAMQAAQQAAMQAEQQQPGTGQQAGAAIMQQAQETVTQEAVAQLLAEQRTRPFILDIETDSTIFPDENAEKERRAEFIQAVGGFMAQALPLAQAVPQAAPMAAQMLKFVAGAFRADRRLDDAIDQFADEIAEASKEPRPDPAQAAMQAEAEAKQAEMQMKAQDVQMRMQSAQQDAQMRAAEMQMKMQGQQADAQAKQAEAEARLQIMAQEAALQAQKTGVEIEKIRAEIAKIEADIGRIGAQAQAARMKPEASNGPNR